MRPWASRAGTEKDTNMRYVFFICCMVLSCWATSAPGQVRSQVRIGPGAGGFTGAVFDGDRLGTAVAGLCDLDQNGVDDLAVGAPGNDGAVWIVFLDFDGTAVGQQQIASGIGGLPDTAATGESLGLAIASVGDVDGDGICDLAAGSTETVWVLFLNRDGTTKPPARINVDTLYTANFDPAVFSLRSLGSLGDTDGPGPVATTLVVGVDAVDANAGVDGVVWLLFLASDGTVLSHRQYNNKDVEAPGDRSVEFGRTVAAVGDVDGNGMADLAVGARDALTSPYANSDQTWILRFKPDWSVEGALEISARSGGFDGALAEEDFFGASAALVDDFDRNGIVDLAVGASGDDGYGIDRGAVWLLYLLSDGSVSCNKKISSDLSGFHDVLNDHDRFGSAIARLADIDGDGVSEIAVGAPHPSTVLPDNQCVWLLFMDGVGLQDYGDCQTTLDFSILNDYPNREIDQDTPFLVTVYVPPAVKLDSAKVFFRIGGEREYRQSNLLYSDDPPVFQKWVYDISGRSSGIQYFVHVYRESHSATSGPRVLRTRVSNADFPFALQDSVYRMISIPFDMQATMFGTLNDDFNRQDKGLYRLFCWDTEAKKYLEVPDENSVFEFELGRSYWIISRDQKLIDTGPAKGLTAPPDAPYVIRLGPGWNMIGNPFNFPVSWDSVMVNGVPASDPASGVAGPIRFLPDGSGYDPLDVAVLDPFEGYWVRNVESIDLVLKVPPFRYLGETRASWSDSEPLDWRISVSVVSGGVFDRGVSAGGHPGAILGWDVRDRILPPARPGRCAYVYFPRSDWGRRSGTYSVDVRNSTPFGSVMGGDPEESTGQTWAFDVAKNFTSAEVVDRVTLEFNGLSTLPLDAAVGLIDRELHRRVDLRKVQRYDYHMGQKDEVKSESDSRFVLLVGTRAFVESGASRMAGVPLAAKLEQNRPNPFNPSTLIRYHVSEAGRVDLRVYDTAGRLIKILFSGVRAPAIYEISWDGTNNLGESVASGIYFCRLESVNRAQTVKMLLLK